LVRVYRSRYGNSHTVEVRDQQTTQKFTQTWTVELEDSDGPLLTEPEIVRMPGLPVAGFSTYRPRNGFVVPFALCRSVTPKPRGTSMRLWDVVCNFELTGAEQQNAEPDDQTPTDLRPRIEPFVESIDQVAYKDWDGKDILDPFKRLWDQPVKVPIPLSGVRVTRYVSAFNEQTLAYWLETTNETTWRQQPEDAWRIRAVEGKEVEFGPYHIGQLKFEIVSNPLELSVQIGTAAPAVHRIGWLELRAARSIKFKNAANKMEINRIEREGDPEPTWIDKDGKKSADPYFFAYRTRRQRNFNQIVRS
jgi:hypothetical protein